MEDITKNLQEVTKYLNLDSVKSFLLTERCEQVLLKEFDFFDVPCLKHVVSKGLSVGIIAGSFLLKLPQILRILAKNSAAGLSFLGLYLELVNYTITCIHCFRHSNPLVAWAETLNLAVQDVVLLTLIMFYQSSYVTGIPLLALYVGACYGASDEALLSNERLEIAMSLAIFIMIASKLPQIWLNFRNGSTGQLSAITVGLTFLGSVARVFTTLQEMPDDAMMVASFGIASALNGVLMAQVLWYWNVSTEKAAQDATKKRQ